jgi:hypothetical protein
VLGASGAEELLNVNALNPRTAKSSSWQRRQCRRRPRESNTPDEIAQKLKEYFESGTRLTWVIDRRRRPSRSTMPPDGPTRVPDVNGQLDGEQVVRGFTLPVADLFRNVAPPG